MEDPLPLFIELQAQASVNITQALIVGGTLIALLLLSATISSSEVAFFSLRNDEIDTLEAGESPTDQGLWKIYGGRDPEKKKKLLASLLLASNFLNITSVVLTFYLCFEVLLLDEKNPVVFVAQSAIVTVILVVFAEVVPKHYAWHHRLPSLRRNFPIIRILLGIFDFPARLLARGSKFIDRLVEDRHHTLTVDELNQAIDITFENEVTDKEERALLKGIVNFGNRSAGQIMQPRHKVMSVSSSISLDELKFKIAEDRYSRIPVYEDTPEQITGVLHAKDLLQLKETDTNWNALVRSTIYVPLSRKIDGLLKDFQEKRLHMAVIINEFGGFEGVVTMEDVLEEIFGEINDEYDHEEPEIVNLGADEYRVAGHISLSDLARVFELDPDYFSEFEGSAETIAGLVLELAGEIPAIGTTFLFRNLHLSVEQSDGKKISVIHVRIESNTSFFEA